MRRCIYCLLLLIVGNGEEEESTAIQISVCRAFRDGHFADGLFSRLVCVNCSDTRVSIPSLAASLLLLFALVGNIKVVIFAGENSALYSMFQTLFVFKALRSLTIVMQLGASANFAATHCIGQKNSTNC